MNISNYNVKDAYLRAIAQVSGTSQKNVKEDIHIAKVAPGGWSGGRAILEIYCEGWIPSPDINFETWIQIDEVANNLIRDKYPNTTRQFFHEPVNGAVVCVWEA
jgi:hypothetical protein